MKTVKVIFESKNYIITRINRSDEQIRSYYAIGSTIGFDSNDKIAAIEFLKKGE